MQRLPELNPPVRLLMGPGPSNPDVRVLRALTTPILGHLDPAFLALMEEVQEDLRQIFQTKNAHTLLLSATGTSGVETMMVNLLEPGDEAIICSSGFFGQRMIEQATRTGANVRTVEVPFGEVITPDLVEAELKKKPAKLVGFIHAETSTGALQPAAEIAAVAHQYGALVAMDCVTSLGGIPVKVDEWGIDAASSCSQKCLGSIPGMAPATFSPRAFEAIKNRKTKVPSLYWDLNMLFNYWNGAHGFHHTMSSTLVYGLREALRVILEEGLEARFERHAKASRAFEAGLEALGITIFTTGPRLPQLKVVNIPAGIDDVTLRKRLLEMDIEIAGGFGPLAGKTWRIGLMGTNATMKSVTTLLAALEQVLAEQGYSREPGAAVAAAAAVFKA
ncbi:MAG TPA: alanine--glyoxylate aminotransferase family protein [Symbiobacteriaceae bacterium]|nr:alanine--glyoxylate aminotransferase family protein [Symbiobacteriaceae bacterium]